MPYSTASSMSRKDCMDTEHFEELVLAAIDELPDEFKKHLENVDITVQDYPTRVQLSRLPRNMTLLGLYEGVPQTRRGRGYNLVPPDKITLFQKPIEAKCRNDEEVRREVGKVLRHEIAHHFGISDATLDRLDASRKNIRR